MATQASTRPQKTGTRSLPRSSPLPNTATIGDLLKRLGNIPAERVRLQSDTRHGHRERRPRRSGPREPPL